MRSQDELARARNALSGRIGELVKQAEREGRDFSRREGAEVRELERKLEVVDDELRAMTPTADDLTQMQAEGVFKREIVTDWGDENGGAGLSGEGRASLTLGREQRMGAWQARRQVPSRFDESDARNFSLGRTVRGMVTGKWDDAELERRALSEGSNAAGGFLTPEPLAGYVIDRVRNRARVLEAGARTVPMDSDTLAIPRLASGVVGAWRNENAPVAESDPVFERITLTARTLAVIVRVSYELVMDMTPAGAEIVENELTSALSLELDRVALRGTGTAPEPRGIRNTTGVMVQSLGANGGVPSYDSLIDAVSSIQGANQQPTAAIFASRTAKTFGALKDSTGQALALPPFLEGVRFLVSNQAPINLTQGTNSDTSEIYVGDFSQLLIGIRPTVGISLERRAEPFSVSLKRSDERYIDQMQVGLLCFLRADVAVAQPAAFTVITGARP